MQALYLAGLRVAMANDLSMMTVGPALQGSVMPAWLMTMAGDMICTNLAFDSMIGAGVSSLATASAPCHPPREDIEFTHLLAQFSAGETTAIKCRIAFQTDDGTVIEHDCICSPVVSNGKAVAIYGQLRRQGVTPARTSPQQPVPAVHKLNMLAMITETNGVAGWYCNLADRSLNATDSYFRMLGFTPGEITLHSRWVRNRIHPDDREEAIRQIEEVIAGKRDMYRVDYRLRCKDGTWKWFHATGQIREFNGKHPARFIYGSLVDISRHKADESRLQDALRESETAYALMAHKEEIHRVATESGGIAPWNIDPVTGAAWWSDGFAKLLGYDIGKLPPQSNAFRRLIHPDDQPSAIKGINALIEGSHDVYDVDLRLHRKDGEWIWCQATARLVNRDHMGQSGLLCGSLKDISPRKAFEQQLETALHEAEKARDDAMAARAEAQDNADILRVSSDSGNVVPWTRIAATRKGWFGANLNKLLGVPDTVLLDSVAFRDLIHPDDLPAVVRNHADVDSGKRSDYAQDFRVRHSDGSWRWFSSKGRKIDRAKDGLPDMVCGSLTNIDHLKENEARLAQVAAQAETARAEAQASEDMLRASAVSGSIGPWNVCPDTNSGWMMDVTYRMLGYDPDDFVPNRAGWRSLIHPDDAPDAIKRMNALISGTSDVYEAAHRLRHKDGSYHWYRAIARRIDRTRQGLPFLIAGATTPIGHLKENEARLAEAADAAQKFSDRLTSIADNAPAGLFEFRLFSDGTSDLPYTSARFDELIGFKKSDCNKPKTFPFDKLHPDDTSAVMDSIFQSASSLEQWSHRFRLMHPDNGLIWLAGSSTPKRQKDGTVVWIGAVHDVTNDVNREAELRAAHQAAERMRAENEKQALHDVLTNLPNRRYFDQTLAKRLADAKANKESKDCVLIRIDADRFKYINDTLGHGAGDDVLIRIADILKTSIRDSDFAARIGGDEFSVILGPDSSEDDARVVVDRIQEKMGVPLIFNGRQCHIKASFGVAHVADISYFGAEIQSFADAALYRAKEKGRNRMEFFTPDLHRDFVNAQSLATELYDAIENDAFTPFFHPQIDAKTGKLTGVEALVRWQHPQKGIVTPDHFLKVAEQLKLVSDIDRIMLEKSSQVVDRLGRKGLRPPKISFNVGLGRLHDPALISEARRIIQGGTMVTFELVESILIEEEGAEFKRNLARIREAGIDIELDDFGSGHASIIGLMEVLPSALKIDRRIIQPVASHEKSTQLVRAIIQIADAFGIHTVAEGVETVEQAQILKELGCDVFQGFLFAKPLNESDLETYLRSH